MREIDQYDLPLPPEDGAALDPIADELVRSKRWELFALSALAIAGGLAFSRHVGSFGPLGRSGALLTALSILRAWRSLLWSKMIREKVEHAVLDVFTTIERQKLTGPDADREASATAFRRVSRAMPPLVAAVQHRFLRDHLLVGFVGTLIWGFGDLPGYWYQTVVGWL